MGRDIQTEKNQDFCIFFRIDFFHNLPLEWFYNVDKMAVFLNAFQLFLFIFFFVLLGYNRHTALFKFKVCSLTPLTMLRNDNYNKFS